MGSFYSGFGGHKSFLGHCDDGIIYSGSGNRTPIGRYENGNIYNQFKEHVGSYGGGSIYDACGTHIASYNGGSVYNKYLNVAVGKGSIGSYEGDPAEAAAMVLLFLGGNDINGNSDSSADENNHTSSTIYSSSGSSDTGCLFGVLSSIWYFALKIIGIVFAYYVLPGWMSYTVIGMPLMALFIAGIVPVQIAFVCLVLLALAIPYWIILFVQKYKRKMTWKETFKYYCKWFIKGPWAYKDVIELQNSPTDK